MEENTKTTIQIDNQTWEDLNKLKGRGESFDEVISKLIKISEKRKKKNDN